MTDEMFDPYEQALLWGDEEVGIVITPDEQMHLVKVDVDERVISDCLEGAAAQSLATQADLRFWFQRRDSARDVNRMATLNLFAVAGETWRTTRLLHGPVLITSVDHAGELRGLSNTQMKLLAHEPSWWQQRLLRLRVLWHEHRRRS